MSLLCLDSYANAELHCSPAVRVLKGGSQSGYPLEVTGLSRKGVFASCQFKARGDGSDGALPDPKKSILRVGNREFTNPHVEMAVDSRGDDGRPGVCEGKVEFALDSAVKTANEYSLEFGGHGVYGTFPTLCVRRDVSSFQRQVSRFLADYVAKEWESTDSGDASQRRPYDTAQLHSAVLLPDVPQQETANDCGFFILEQILQALQLTPEEFRQLANASAAMVSSLPWPSQKDVARRKTRLREAVSALFKAAEETGKTDVEVLLKEDPELRSLIQDALWDGRRFAEAARILAAHSAPRQKFSVADLGAMPTKELRGLCTQHGVLPPGSVDRTDLLRALVPVVVAPPSSEPTPKQAPAKAAAPVAPAAAPASAPEPAEAPKSAEQAPESQGQKRTNSVEHLSTLRFTVADLATLPLKTLRGLCVQHRVLPPCAMERSDFVQALTPLASATEADAGAAPAGAGEAESTTGAAEDPEREATQRKAKWQKVAASGEHLGGLQFTEADLAVMAMKTLKGLCVQYKVLPSCAVERSDFVKALIPFAAGSSLARAVAASRLPPPARAANGSGAAAAAKDAPAKRDFSKFLGSMKPNFSAADLAEMPDGTLRTLCMQHGVLPPGDEPDRRSLLEALGPLAIRTNSKMHYDEIMQVDAE